MLAFSVIASVVDPSEDYYREFLKDCIENTTNGETYNYVQKVLISKDYYTYDGSITYSEYYNREEKIEKFIFYDKNGKIEKVYFYNSEGSIEKVYFYNNKEAIEKVFFYDYNAEGTLIRIEKLNFETKEKVKIYDIYSGFPDIFGIKFTDEQILELRHKIDPGNGGTFFVISTYKTPHVSYIPVESWSDSLDHLTNITVGYVIGEMLSVFIPCPVANLISTVLSEYTDLSPAKNATYAIQEGRLNLEKIVKVRNISQYVNKNCVYAHAIQYYRMDIASAFLPVEFDNYGQPIRYHLVREESNKGLVGEKRSLNYYNNSKLLSIAKLVWDDYTVTGTLNVWNEW